MSLPALDGRLSAAAEFARQGAVFADIGTDHAYLPLFLLAQRRIRFAYCCDIGEGPLATAKAHAAETPFLPFLDFRLTDGLSGLEDTDVTDIAVCGMGGELIAQILERAPWVKDPRFRLILQPMTRHAHLRRFLAGNGFTVEKERFCSAEGKDYVCLRAVYAGKPEILTPLQAEFGKEPDRADPAFLRFLHNRYKALLRAAEGKERGGVSSSEERELISSAQIEFSKEILP